MKIWTCGSSPQSGSRNAWTRIKNINSASHLSNFGNFSTLSRRFPVMIGDHGRNLVITLWPKTKQQSMEWWHNSSPRPQKFQVQEFAGKVLPSIFLGSRRYPPHWLSSKGPNYQGGVLLISAGATEGHFEGKTPQEGHQGVLFLHNNALAHWALATQKKLVYLGFQCLDHPPYSLDLAPSDYHLFPGLKKQLGGCHFSSDAEVIAAAEN